MADAFASLDTVRIDLPGGGWIEVKSELSWGEEQALYAGGMGRLNVSNPQATIDLAEYNIRRVLAWVTEWSFTDKDGNTVPVTRKNVEALRSRIGQQIHNALDEHIRAAEGNS